MSFWTVLTYLYNSLLVIFIAVHLFVGSILSFGIGIYVGIYLAQNYHVPRVDEPYKLLERFLIFLEQYRKGGGVEGSMEPLSTVFPTKPDDKSL